MKKTKKLLVIVGGIVGVCVLLILAFIAEENLRGRILLGQVQRRLRAQHEALTLAELRLPDLPKEENAGPAIVQAAKELDALARSNPLASAGSSVMAMGEPGQAKVRHHEPFFPSMLALGQPKRDGKPPTYEWSQAERELANAEASLSKLRQALRQPVAVPVVDYGKDLSERFESAPWKASIWFLTAAVDALHAQNLEAAVENIAASLSLADYQSRDHRMMGQISAMTVNGSTLALIWAALQDDGWTDAQLARLQAALSRAHTLEDALGNFELERAMIASRFAQIRQSNNARLIVFRLEGINLVEEMLGDKETPMPSEWIIQLRSVLWWAAWAEQDEARALQRWQEFLVNARLLRKEKSWTAFAKRYPKDEHKLQGLALWRGSFSETLNPQTGWALLSRVARMETQRQMTLAAIALKRCALRTGGAPPSLEALVPDLLPEVPTDLMDGRPLRYRRAEDGKTFVLYSVGTDGQDNGGDPTPGANGKLRDLWAGRDVLWPRAVTAR
jgi:hypothetical protein